MAKADLEVDVEAFERKLRGEYKRSSDEPKVERLVTEFRENLEHRFDADEARSEEEIKEEEHVTISLNLILSLSIALVFTIWVLVRSEQLIEISRTIKSFIATNLGWFFVILSTSALFYLGYLAFSRFGDVVLGDPEDQPEFSTLSWYSMLFSAGMGVGILFWGCAEPITHFLSNPVMLNETTEAARHALALTMFHWGFHGWGVYTLCAVAVAYYGFRRRKSYLVSSAVTGLAPSQALDRPLALLTDLTATLAIVFGLAASLGTGTLQLAAGLDGVLGLNTSHRMGYLAILAVITIAFIASATTGLKKGIKILSNLNMATCVTLMFFVFLVGPSLFIIKLFVDTTGGYLAELPSLSFQVAPFTPVYEQWMSDWTITYFTWWIAWAPFVGIFIARISRGRTIKELILGAMLVPTLFTVAWFSIFGGAALQLTLGGDQGLPLLIQEARYQEALFYLLGTMPWAKLTGVITVFLIFTFLVTSADSACFVLAMMTSEGDLDPSMRLKVLWAVVMATVTGLLVQHGNLGPIQAVAQMSAIPFSFILILMAFSLPLRLRHQVKKLRL